MGYFPVSQDVKFTVELDEETKNAKYFYISLDRAFAGESDASELKSWNNYIYSGDIDKVLDIDECNGKATLSINLGGSEYTDDVIGFRIYAVNADGTYVDPDGRAFYVEIGKAAVSLPAVKTEIVVNPYDNQADCSDFILVNGIPDNVINATYVSGYDENEIDLLILDRNICGEDALNFVKSLREEAYNEPVIFLTAKALKRDILEGFESGCDDYVCKPFDFDELLLRMKALLKRSKRQNSKISFKNILLDIENRQCFEDNQEVKVSNLEFELLKCFFENKNVLLTRQFLSENVWLDEFTNDKSINIAITRLRNKFKVLKEQIHSIRGVGYKLC